MTERVDRNLRRSSRKIMRATSGSSNPDDFTPNIIVLLDRLTPEDINAAITFKTSSSTKATLKSKDTIKDKYRDFTEQANNLKTSSKTRNLPTRPTSKQPAPDSKAPVPRPTPVPVPAANKSIDSIKMGATTLSSILKSCVNANRNSTEGSDSGSSKMDVDPLKTEENPDSSNNHLCCIKCRGDFFSIKLLKEHLKFCTKFDPCATVVQPLGNNCVSTPDENDADLLYSDEDPTDSDCGEKGKDAECSYSDGDLTTLSGSDIEIIDNANSDSETKPQGNRSSNRTRSKRRKVNYADVKYLKCRYCVKKFSSVDKLILHRKVCRDPRKSLVKLENSGSSSDSGSDGDTDADRALRDPKTAQNNEHSDDSEDTDHESPRRKTVYECAVCEEKIHEAVKETHVKKCIALMAPSNYEKVVRYCQICNLLLKSRQSLSNHFTRKHRGHKMIPIPLVNCKVCTRKFSSMWHLEVHMKAAHKAFLGKKKGGGGDGSTTGTDRVTPNRDRKPGERPFACPVENCGKRFICIAHLNSHKNMQHRDTLKASTDTTNTNNNNSNCNSSGNNHNNNNSSNGNNNLNNNNTSPYSPGPSLSCQFSANKIDSRDAISPASVNYVQYPSEN